MGYPVSKLPFTPYHYHQPVHLACFRATYLLCLIPMSDTHECDGSLPTSVAVPDSVFLTRSFSHLHPNCRYLLKHSRSSIHILSQLNPIPTIWLLKQSHPTFYPLSHLSLALHSSSIQSPSDQHQPAIP